jgi:hypothetical protein
MKTTLIITAFLILILGCVSQKNNPKTVGGIRYTSKDSLGLNLKELIIENPNLTSTLDSIIEAFENYPISKERWPLFIAIYPYLINEEKLAFRIDIDVSHRLEYRDTLFSKKIESGFIYKDINVYLFEIGDSKYSQTALKEAKAILNEIVSFSDRTIKMWSYSFYSKDAQIITFSSSPKFYFDIEKDSFLLSDIMFVESYMKTKSNKHRKKRK